MTDDKVKSVFKKYLNLMEAEDPQVSAAQFPEELTKIGSAEIEDCAWRAHFKFMCVEGQKFVDEGRRDKAMRWLGFLQGVLWECGHRTLDELKNDSRPDVENESY